MAKIVQTLTRASAEYEEDVAQSLVRDLDAVLEKLNKFVGIDDSASGSALTPFGSGNPLVSETYVIKSILVTSAGTPTVTIINNGITTIKSAALTANTTTELLTQPLIVEGGKTFTIQSSSSDSFDVAISYLNIKKETVS